MRPIKLFSTLGLLLYLPLYAQELSSSNTIEEATKTNISKTSTPSTTKNDQLSTIERLIKNVQTAPDGEKRVLMNQLKIQLKSMNKESRHQAMIKLKQSFTKNSHQKRTTQLYKQEKKKHDSCQHRNHQPKFRHLRQGLHDGLGPHQGDRRR